MAYNLKEEVKKPERFTGGHRMCAGCGAPPVVRCILRAVDPEDHVVVGAATGCLEVSSCMFPFTAWKDSFIHSAFENVAATVSGAEAAYKALKRRGAEKQNTKFIAFGGDGGTYDIGLQALSGAMERGHDMVYICYDNGAYMNTGIQRSSATPTFSDTSTSPAGSVIPGKMQKKKDLTLIVANHHIPYVAQSAPLGNFKDLAEKARKAIYTKGASFMNVIAPCPRGWRYDTADLIDITKLAVETCVWPLFEVEEGKYTINYRPKKKADVTEFLRPQGRFAHMFKPGNEWMIEAFQKAIDEDWERLQHLAETK